MPDLEANLFSQGSALDKGLSLISNAKNAQLINEDKIVCAMVVRSGKLFKMLFQVDHRPHRLVARNEGMKPPRSLAGA